MESNPLPQPGQLVRVSQRQYLVEDITSPTSDGEATLVSLTAPLRDWLGEFRPSALLILDKAHHAAPASGARYAIDSKITRAIRDLAPRFEHRLSLSQEQPDLPVTL